MPSRRHVLLTVAAATASLALSACGTSETPAPAAPSGGASSAAQPVTVTDSRGKRITLKNGPAQRVVSLEWTETEMALTVGANLVGVADAKGYSTWNTAAKLPESVKDLGKRTEPSVDAIVATNPDLVIMENSPSTKSLVAQLEKYVPVLVTKGSDAKDDMARMKTDMQMIGTAVGKKSEADQAMADLDSHLAQAKQKVADAGKTGTEFMVLDGWVEGSAVNIRMFAKGSLMSNLGEQIGLKNAWTGKGDPEWGLQTTDLEGLAPARASKGHVFYSASEEDIFTTTLAKNPLWSQMGFVKEKHLHKLAPGTWTFGGPSSAKNVVDQYVTAVTG